MWTEPLLELRPTNIVHQLGAQSRIPVLNARDLLFGLDGTNATLWLPRVSGQEEIAGVLRAASHSRSPLGMSMFVEGDVARFQHENPVGSLIWKACEQAQSFAVCPPLCFHVQLPSIQNGADTEVDSVCSLVTACVEAGFTSFGLDLRGSAAADDFSWVYRVLTPALELELAFAVQLDFAHDGDPQGILDGLRAAGVFPDIALLSDQSEHAVESETFVRVLENNPDLNSGWLGKSKQAPGELFNVLVGEMLTEDMQVDGPDTGDQSLRLEAKAYTRALVRIKRLGLKGTMEHLVSRLVSR